MAQKHRSAPPFHLGDGYEVSDLRFSDPKTHFRRELPHTSKERMLARKAKKDLDRPGWASPLNLPVFDQTLFVQSLSTAAQDSIMSMQRGLHTNPIGQGLESFWIAEHLGVLECDATREGRKGPHPFPTPCSVHILCDILVKKPLGILSSSLSSRSHLSKLIKLTERG